MQLNSQFLKVALSALALIGATLGYSSAALGQASNAGESVSVAVGRTDMRGSDLAAVRSQAAARSRDGIVLVVYGGDTDAMTNVEGAALDAVAARLPVKSIIWARDTDGAGVSVYGVEGAPFGPRIPFNSDVRASTKGRIDELAILLGKAGAVVTADGAAPHVAPDQDDVIRCRVMKETGSRLRGVRVCSTRRQDRERQLRARDSADEMVNRLYTTNDDKMGGG